MIPNIESVYHPVNDEKHDKENGKTERYKGHIMGELNLVSLFRCLAILTTEDRWLYSEHCKLSKVFQAISKSNHNLCFANLYKYVLQI